MSRKKKKGHYLEILMFMIMGVTALCCVLLVIALTFDNGNLMDTFDTLMAKETKETAGGNESTSEEETMSASETDPTPDSNSENSKPGVVEMTMVNNTTTPTIIDVTQPTQPPESTTQPTQPPVNTQNPNPTAITNYVFVGDSRYVGMSIYAQANDRFIAEVGQGYEYFTQQINTIKSICGTNTAIIIGLGVNDMSADFSSSYINTINQLAAQVSGKVYYMLVNPVDEGKEHVSGYHITNAQIDSFNAKMKAGLASYVGVIDTNSFLKYDGYYTTDGVHYDNATYLKIYQYIKANII